MNERADLRVMASTSRGKVYLLWAALVGIGFVWTHLYQNPNINIIWTVLSIVGFGYMYKAMPLKLEPMRRIYASWLIPVFIGMAWSVLAVRTDILPELVSYLGPFWLIVMAVGYIWNGLVDSPGLWYYIAGAVNVLAAIAIYLNSDLLEVQYLLIAVISIWSMLMLWVFRADS